MSAMSTPERLRLVAVDVEIDGRGGGGEGGEHARQPLVLVGGADQRPASRCPSRRVAALQVLQLVFEAAAGGQADDRRQVEREDGGGADLLRAAEDPPDHRLGAVRRARRSANGFSLATMKPRCSRRRRRAANSRPSRATRSHLRHRLAAAPPPGPPSRVRGTEAPSGNCTKMKNAPWSSSGRKPVGVCCDRPKTPTPAAPISTSAEDGHPHQPAHHRGVAVAHVVDAPQHPAHRARARLPCVAQEHRAQRRRQGQRVDRRDHHGDADGDGELAEQQPGQPGDEGRPARTPTAAPG